MAHSATSPAARLKRLETALAEAKKLKRGTVLTGQSTKEMSMARLIGVSWPVLRDWCREIPGFAESGAFEGGGNGIEYRFKPVPTIKFLIRHFEAERDARAAKAREHLRLVAGDRFTDVSDDLDLDDLRKLIQLQSAVREERERAGELIEAAKAREALNAMTAAMQRAGVKAASQQDPTGRWPPEIRESFEDAVNNVLVAMQREGEKALRALRGGTA